MGLAYKASFVEPPSIGWTGAYWGATGGGAATKSNVISAERDAQAFPTNQRPFGVNGIDLLATSRGHNAGGLLDVFAGWNAQVSNFVVGGQLEATAANLDFTSAGVKTFTYFDGNGPTGQSAVGVGYACSGTYAKKTIFSCAYLSSPLAPLFPHHSPAG